MPYPKVKQGHVVTAAYLRSWAIDNQISMRLVGDAAERLVSVRDAATRGPFYRRTRPDGTKIDDVEWSLAQAEDKMLPVLREIEQRWPLSAKDKSVIAQFIGLQMVRGPLWYEWHRDFQRDGFADLRRLEDKKAEPDHAGIDATEQWLATDTQEHVRMLSLAPKVGAVIGCMHWTLLRFGTPRIATSDHPVVVWPESDTSRSHIAPMTIEGVLTSLEVRFPLTPQLALLATWLDLPDPEAAVIQGTRRHASNLNTFTIGQAEKQWFHLPRATTPTTTGRLVPLSPQFFPAYNAGLASESARRSATRQLIQPYLGKNFPGHIQLIWVTRPSIFEYSPSARRRDSG